MKRGLLKLSEAPPMWGFAVSYQQMSNRFIRDSKAFLEIVFYRKESNEKTRWAIYNVGWAVHT